MKSVPSLVPGGKAVLTHSVSHFPHPANVVNDRGIKNKAVELFRVLLNGDLINMVDGNFSSIGMLIQSIEKFLNKPDGTPRLFIIGITPGIFNKLKKLVLYPPLLKVALNIPNLFRNRLSQRNKGLTVVACR